MSSAVTADGGLHPRLRPWATKIAAAVGRPKDAWEVAAHLEVSGIRDADAREEYGCADVFDLARRVLVVIDELHLPVRARQERVPPLPWRFLKAYATGILFSMPMAAQIFAMALFGHSLWAWIGFDLRDATAIGLGTLGSFLVTAGFAQAISRRGLFYLNQHEDVLLEKISYRLLAAGGVTVAVTGLALLLANLVFEFIPLDMVFHAQLYFYLLSCLWLSFSILYMLGRELLFALITVVGLLTVHAALLFFRPPMVLAHAAGLLAAILLSGLTGWFILRRGARRAQREFMGTELPRPSILVYSIAPYFWYGVLYFSFLFADRFIAWSSETGRGFLPYFIWFETRYELGMDWALLCFVVTFGVLEFTMQEFASRIVPEEQRARAVDRARFNRRFTRFYYGHLLLFVVIAVISVTGAWMGLHWLRHTGTLPFIEVFFNPITERVFWWAAAGYGFLVFGLFNSVFLFALSRPGFALRALGAALVANVVVGFVLSRVVRYDLAAAGLLTGAIVFALLSGLYTRRAFRRLDYYYYSAY